jgi:hypothetical protein
METPGAGSRLISWFEVFQVPTSEEMALFDKHVI